MGRCRRKRQRNQKNKESSGISQSHLSEYVTLHRWMKSCVKNERLETSFKYFLEPASFKETGRGLRARKKIHAGETIVSIPHQLLITTDTVFESEIGSLILRKKQQFTPQQLLSVFLVLERNRGESSHYFPYINTLPEVYTTPLYFSYEELELLAPRAKHLAELSRQRFNKALERITNFMNDTGSPYQYLFHESAVRWAWSTINTRSVYVENKPHPLLNLDPEESNVALAPYLDLLNHRDNAKITAGINGCSNSYEIVTLDHYRKNDQVFICYGAHDNIKLLVNYGFTLPQNVHNCFVFSLDDILQLNENIQHWNRKSAIIEDAQLKKNLICTVDGVSWSLMTTLKVIALSWEQLPSFKLLLQGASISQDNEKCSHHIAVHLINTTLQKARAHLILVEKQPKSTHHDLLKNLAQDDVHILECSLSSLESR